jgi:hypothetical protein
MNGKEFINNFRNIRRNPFSPSSPSSLITRGDIQKRNRTRQIAQGETDTSQDNGQAQEALPTVPKAPSFHYKNPATDDNIAYWKKFTDPGTMRHYDDLMNILGNVEELGTVDDIRKYISSIKDTTMYKVLPGVQAWTNDLESFYYGLDDKYDLSYPVDLMRYQTTKAKSAFENGYRSSSYPEARPRSSSPSELLPQIKSSFK